MEAEIRANKNVFNYLYGLVDHHENGYFPAAPDIDLSDTEFHHFFLNVLGDTAFFRENFTFKNNFPKLMKILQKLTFIFSINNFYVCALNLKYLLLTNSKLAV